MFVTVRVCNYGVWCCHARSLDKCMELKKKIAISSVTVEKKKPPFIQTILLENILVAYYTCKLHIYN